MKKLLFFASAVAMLASCSKDMTEDLAPVQVTGKSTIYATYNGGSDATRTHLEPGTGAAFEIAWDQGDAVGVFNAEAGDEANAFYAYTGEEAEDGTSIFKGDMTLLDAEEYVAYYPYERGTEIDENGNLSVIIPEKQNYSLNKENGADGTFASNVAPAVAYGIATESSLNMTFYPLATYIQVPVRGIGTINKLELTIGNGTTNKKLAGKVTVNIDDVAAGKYTRAGGAEPKNECDSETITLNFAKKEVSLKMDEITYFWFVIPAYTDLYQQTMTITINDGEGVLKREFDYTASRKTPINTPIEIGQDADENGAVPFQWISGGEDKYQISDVYSFIEYAYAATNGLDKVPADHPMINVDAQGTKTLKGAMIIVDEIDFDDVDVDELLKDYTEPDGVTINEFKKAVYNDWYDVKNGEAIETIGGGANYSITGNAPAGAATIKNMKVKGDGVFASQKPDNATGKEKPVISNIVLKDAEVTSPKGWFVAKEANNITLTDVVIDGGELKTETTGSLFETVKSESFSKGTALKFYKPTGVVNYAHFLDVYTNDKDIKTVTFSDEFFAATGKTGYNNAYKVLFGTIDAQDGSKYQGTIVTVPSESMAFAFIAAIDVERRNTSKDGWFSVVTREEVAAAAAEAEAAIKTSYWTGFTMPVNNKNGNAYVRDNGDGIMTAEELAAVVLEGAKAKNGVTKLTNDIDLGYNKAWVTPKAPQGNGEVGGGYYVTIDGAKADGEKFKISRVDSKTALFGPSATVSNLKVDNVFVNNEAPYVLAKTGTAKNVEISNINYERVAVSPAAGLFYEGTIADLMATTGCKVGVKAGSLDSAIKYGALYAKITGAAGHTYAIPAYTIPAGYNPFAMLLVTNDGHAMDQDGHTQNMYLDFEGFTSRAGMPQASELVVWNDMFDTNTSVFFRYKGETNTDNYTAYTGDVYKSAGNTAELQAAIADLANLKKGDTATIALGDGEFASKNSTGNPTWAEGVTITFIGNGADKTTLSNFEYATAKGSTVLFQDLTLSVFESNSLTSLKVEAAKEVTFNNVTIKGSYYTGVAEKVTFNGCKFLYGGGGVNNAWRAGLWIETAGTTVVNSCEFDMTKEGTAPASAICINNDTTFATAPVTGNVTVTGCKFTGKVATNDAAIQINPAKFSGTKKSTLTVSNNTVDPQIFKGGLHNAKDTEVAKYYTVVEQ